MKNNNSTRWTMEDEALYLEERKYRCECCDPEHEATIKWLESSNSQDLVVSVYKTYGIPPHVVFREFEDERASIQQAPEIATQYMEKSA
jgi:hypothetical protein